MKLDLSTVFLVVLCVIPGLFALRARNMVCPRSFEQQGAMSELGELVALGVSTHGILVLCGTFLLLISGVVCHLSPRWYFRKLDTASFSTVLAWYRVECLAILTGYVFLSFAVSHWLGIVYGSRRLRNPITANLLLLNKSYLGRKLKISGLLGEKPIIYEAFKPANQTSDEVTFAVFVEIELKGTAGIYTGEVSQFSILKDDEPHKPIYLIGVHFKPSRGDEYVELDVDGVLLDLADAAVVSVTRVAQTEEASPEG